MASSGQNRGFPEIIKFGNQFDQFCDSVSGIATKIASDAGKAESSLKDEVSKRNIQKVYEISWTAGKPGSGCGIWCPMPKESRRSWKHWSGKEGKERILWLIK